MKEVLSPLELEARIHNHAISVYVNEEVGLCDGRCEAINVVPVEGNADEGIGIVVSEPEELQYCPVVAGDFVQWRRFPGKDGGLAVVVAHVIGGEFPVLRGV